VQATVITQVRVAIRVDLDPIRAVFNLLAHGTPQVVGAIHELGAGGHVELPRVAGERIHAGRGERPRRDEHPRAGNDGALDRGLHIDVRIHGAFGLEVANRRESVVQRGARGRHRLDRAVGNRLLEELRRVIAPVEEHVRMGIDQSREDGEPRQVHTLGVACARGDVGVRSDSRYAVADDENSLVRPGGIAHRVDESAGAHEHATLGGCGGLRCERHW
jgi:hypothetical protein